MAATQFTQSVKVVKKSHTANGVKKSAKTKSDSTHPPYAKMIKAAIIDLQNKKGSSRRAILKYINENYDIHHKTPLQTNLYLNQALKHGVENGMLKHVTGMGATGSFKLVEKSGQPEKKATDDSKAKKVATDKSGTSKKNGTASAGGKSSTTKKTAAKSGKVGKKSVESSGTKSGTPKKAKATKNAGETKSAKKSQATKSGKKPQADNKKAKVGKK